MTHRTIPGSTRVHAKALRKELTHAESQLWKSLRGRRFVQTKFRRQQPVGPYILDFYCPESRVSIEVDGGGHATPDQRVYDNERTEYLRSLGIREVRFWSNEIERDLDGALREIVKMLKEKLT